MSAYKTLSAFAGAALVLGSVAAPVAQAGVNPFQVNELSSGYAQWGDKLAEGACGEGKCGEGKCGEGKCGEGKCGEGKCGEGKCGEGKCGSA